MTGCIVVFCTVPSEEVGIEIAENIVRVRAGACGNLVPSLTSIYTWNGAMQKDNELLLIIKSEEKLFEKVEKIIKKIHPYEVPEIIALPIVNGNKEYLDWISESTE